MFLSKVEISGFRNLEHAELRLNSQFNYIYGENGAGKTALLEAVCTLSRGRSFRTSQSNTLINRGTDSFAIYGEAEYGSTRQHKLGIARTQKGETRIRIDGQSSNRTSELARLLPTQVVLPDAAELIFGAPGVRRSFLEWGLFHVEPHYLELSRKYRRALQQRNAWLKDAADATLPERDPWLGQVKTLGLSLGQAQKDYLVRFEPYFLKMLALLSPDVEIKASYYWGGLEAAEMADKKWSESFPRDVKFGLTHRGPHRADIVLEERSVLASEVLSRGQAKAVASAMILAQTLLQIEETDQACVLLIDDFGAELDREHWIRFLEVLRDIGCQVIATSTVGPEHNEVWVKEVECDVFHVKHGVVEKVRSSD